MNHIVRRPECAPEVRNQVGIANHIAILPTSEEYTLRLDDFAIESGPRPHRKSSLLTFDGTCMPAPTYHHFNHDTPHPGLRGSYFTHLGYLLEYSHRMTFSCHRNPDGKAAETSTND